MGKRILAVIIFLVVVAGAIYLLYKKSAKPVNAPTQEQQQSPVLEQSSPAAPQSAAPSGNNKPVQAGTPPQGTFSSGEGDTDAPDIQVFEVDYNGKVFTPGSVDIHPGDYVMFKNLSTVDFWPQSDPASAYAAFTAGKNITPGKKFSFQFMQTGTWKFSDKLNPAAVGTVTVSK